MEDIQNRNFNDLLTDTNTLLLKIEFDSQDDFLVPFSDLSAFLVSLCRLHYIYWLFNKNESYKINNNNFYYLGVLQNHEVSQDFVVKKLKYGSPLEVITCIGGGALGFASFVHYVLQIFKELERTEVIDDTYIKRLFGQTRDLAFLDVKDLEEVLPRFKSIIKSFRLPHQSKITIVTVDESGQKEIVEIELMNKRKA